MLKVDTAPGEVNRKPWIKTPDFIWKFWKFYFFDDDSLKVTLTHKIDNTELKQFNLTSFVCMAEGICQQKTLFLEKCAVLDYFPE